MPAPANDSRREGLRALARLIAEAVESAPDQAISTPPDSTALAPSTKRQRNASSNSAVRTKADV